MVEVISLVVAVIALGVAVAALVPARRSAVASERSAGAAERAEVAAVKAADRAVKVQQEQATREAYRATLVEFRNAAEEFRGSAAGAALVLRFNQPDLVLNAQRELDRQGDALLAIHSRFGPELAGDVAGAMRGVIEGIRGVVLTTVSPDRSEGWEERRMATFDAAYETLLGHLAEFREAHHAYLTADLTENA